MEFRVLGPLEVADGSTGLLPLGGHKQRAVLARLLLTPNAVVPVEALIEAAWGEDPPEQARGILQVYVANLRRILDGGSDSGESSRIVRRATGYQLRADLAELDLLRFQRLVAHGRVALARHDVDRAADLLGDALALWRGEPFPDLACSAQVPPEVHALAELRLSVLEDRLEADLEAGRGGAVVAELQCLVADHPLRERLHGQLILALYRERRQADALNACRRVRRVLRDELGIDPAPPLQDLERAVLRQDPVLDRSPRSERATLPRAVDEFIGRRAELDLLTEALDRHRIVTLTGTGGVGKTRLAIEVTDRLTGRFPDGVWFADLSPIEDARRVPALLAEALQVSARPGEDILTAVVGALRDTRSLVVLDNCEHVISAACGFVREAVARCPALRVLATSREPLRVRGEAVIPLRPLGVPPPGAAPADSDAVALFCVRGRAAAPSFDPDDSDLADAAEICRRLDGLPLAIELAAVRVAAMSPRQLLQRLEDHFGLLTGATRDLPARQRTLDEVVRWSYELLTPGERALFLRLSVFPASFSLESAEAVTADRLVPPVDLPRLLVGLVDRSLVGSVPSPAGGPRYELLQILRRFGQERLEASGAAALWRDRLLAWALGRVELLERNMRTPRQDALLAEIRLEQHSMRTALQWAAHRGDRLAALRIASSVPLGSTGERCALVQQLLDDVSDAPPSVLAAAYFALANLRTELGEHVRAMEAATAAIRLAESIGDRRRAAWGRHYLIGAAYGAGDLDTVDALGPRLLEDFRSLDEPLGVAYVAWNLALRTPDSARADAWADEAVDTFRALDAPFGLAHALEGRGIVALRSGDAPRAARSIAEAVHLLTASGNVGCTAHALETAAACIARLHGTVAAAEVAGAAEALREESGQALRPWEVETHEQVLALFRGADETVRAARERGRLHSLHSAADVAQRLLTRPAHPVNREVVGP